MNCLDARRILTATPASEEAEVLQHIQQCQSCAAYAEREQLFAAQIQARLKVAVPEGLNARIILQHNLQEDNRSRRYRRYWQALAASVVLTVGVITGMLAVNYPSSLEDVALAHLRDEPMALQVSGDIQLSQLNTMLSPYNLKLQEAIGRVGFAMPCKIRQYVGAHLVMQGEHGKVTVLIMPGEYVMARKTLKQNDVHGVLIPIDVGSIAIIGQADESFDVIEARIQQALIHLV